MAVYGRVPLLYYVLHLFLIHAAAIALAWPTLGAAAVTHPFVAGEPLGYSLPAVYALWVAVVLALYPACRWFADVKRRSAPRLGELSVKRAPYACGVAVLLAACGGNARRAAEPRRRRRPSWRR